MEAGLLLGSLTQRDGGDSPLILEGPVFMPVRWAVCTFYP